MIPTIPPQAIGIGMVLGASIIGAFGALYLKKGANKLSLSPKALVTNYALMLGVALYGLSTIIFIPALRLGELSLLYPFASTTYVWISLLSVRFLGEKMNGYKWAGIICILAGVTFIGAGSV
ncbi:hypothetical protein COY95_03845 [Candidatus Woesearchaeota archaeon CG_4_10_14_0_8_um_filter_47_5]|nr:MAG: hypothetical protein COY95_03845 [Candidatus Woesearchaeota archaeon CG_4_10_14_0_8_um_filter_47_5]